MNKAEKALAILLRISAVLLLTAVVPAVMPFAWMVEIHQRLGLGELSHARLTGYLTRSLSALYAMHGALLMFVSFDVRRFLPVIRCLAVLKLVFGTGMIVLDVAVGMPTWWIVGEGPLIAALGVVLLWLAGGVGRTVS
ncbi:MAG TPA: hypothetical protein VMY42_04035 [Thermoguttaceae bacterium]|nr:hypothetical protein [Thermoguttaceae bacterium]